MTTGMRDIIRYTIEQLVTLNHGKSYESGAIYDLFSKYPTPHIDDYLNPHNHRFRTPTPNAGGGFTLKKAHVYSDQKIIEDIRKVVGNISRGSGKVELAISRLNQLMIPSTQADNIAKLFHKSMIECDFLIEEYLSVLVGFTNTDSTLLESIYRTFIKEVVNEFKNPSKFEDTAAETAYDKQLRWRIRNATILAKLYNMKLPDTPLLGFLRANLTTDIITTKFIDTIFSQLSPTDNGTTQLLVAVWTIVSIEGKRLMQESAVKYKEYIAKIQQILNSPDYKVTDKVRLMNIMT